MTAMDLARSAASDASPPAGISDSARALWLAKAGKWDAAHDLCQEIPGSAGSWIHAYLHRDLGGYFLQFSFSGLRKDRDGWQTASSAIGDRIRAVRKKLGLTQGQLAKRLRVTEGTVFTWETKRNKPSVAMNKKLLDLFGVEIDLKEDRCLQNTTISRA